MSKMGTTRTPISKVSKHTSATSAPAMSKSNFQSSPYSYDEDERRAALLTTPPNSYFASPKNGYKNDFRDSGGIENQSVQELETYAVYKAEETTQKVNDCLKIAEEIREDATRTLVTLHHQGEQITRTHLDAANIEHDLSRGEKLLGSLGGLFSKTWKPKKNRAIKGPVSIADTSFQRKANHTEQREKLGISSNQKERSTVRQHHAESASALEKVEIEKVKQDDALSDLSNMLGQLKEMAVDMGSEIERQNKALDGLDGDVEELNFRVKGANIRGQRLLRK